MSLLLNNGVPLNAYFYAVPAYKVINGDSTIGFYGNDTWQISRRLTVNIGLRFDRQNIFSLNETGPNSTSFPGKISFSSTISDRASVFPTI